MYSKISDFTSTAEIYARPRSPSIDWQRKTRWLLEQSNGLAPERKHAAVDRLQLVNSGWRMGCNIHDHSEWMQFSTL